MDPPKSLVCVQSARAALRVPILSGVGHVLLVELKEGHRPAASKAWQAFLVLQAPQEPAGFFTGGFDFLKRHIKVQVCGDVKARAKTYPDLHDGPADPEAWSGSFLQDVVVVLSRAGEVAEGPMNDIEIDAGDAWAGRAAGHRQYRTWDISGTFSPSLRGQFGELESLRGVEGEPKTSRLAI